MKVKTRKATSGLVRATRVHDTGRKPGHDVDELLEELDDLRTVRRNGRNYLGARTYPEGDPRLARIREIRLILAGDFRK